MVGLVATLMTGLMTGAGFGGGFSASAMTFAPITSYRQGRSFAMGYGEGMVPGLYRNYAIQSQQREQDRRQDLVWRRQDRIFDLQTNLLKWAMNYKLNQLERKTARPEPRFKLVY